MRRSYATRTHLVSAPKAVHARRQPKYSDSFMALRPAISLPSFSVPVSAAARRALEGVDGVQNKNTGGMDLTVQLRNPPRSRPRIFFLICKQIYDAARRRENHVPVGKRSWRLSSVAGESWLIAFCQRRRACAKTCVSLLVHSPT